MTKIIKRIWQGNEIPATKYFLWIKNEDGLYYIYVYGPDGWEKLSTNEFDPDKYYTKEEVDELIPNLSDYYTKEETYSKFEVDERIPTKLSDLQEDNMHRVVSDEQITNWNRAYRAEFDTTRTIWGQSLNGNQNIIGNMEGVGNIVPDVDGIRNIGSTLKKFNIIYADSILGNANTATALSDTNAYTAWGRTFFLNGKPQSIWGNITNVGDIFFSNSTAGARYFNLPSGSDMVFRKAKDATTWRTWMTVSGTDTTNVVLGSETSDVTIHSGNDLKLKTGTSTPTVVTVSSEDITAKKNNAIASVNLGTNTVPFKELYLNPDNGSVLAIGASVRSLLNTQSNLGTAAYSNVASGISENNNDLATSGQVYSYVATKISSGIFFRGVTTTPLVDQCNTNPIIINGSSHNAVVGDLVLLDSSYKEFVWDGTKWDELGDGTSYAIKTTTITIDNTDTASNTRNASTSYITGGGDLQANRTFAVTTYLKDAVDWGNVILGLQGVGMLEKTANGWQISTLAFSGTRDFLGVRYWDSSSNGPLTVTSGVLNLSTAGSGLMLPLAAPSSAVSGKVYLWSNAEGNYSSTPSGGGVTEVSTLYLYKNNTLIDSYNGTIDKSIHIPIPTTVAELSDSSNYALKTWVSNLVENLLGNYVTITGDPQHITSKKYIDKLLVEALLALPESAPTPDTADANRIFLWANASGNYSSTPSGGGGITEISSLHFTRNNQNIGNYDGTVETTINIAVPTAVSQLSDASNYATKAWVEDKHYLVAADLNNYVTLDTEQTITGKKTIGKILVTGYLNIPTSAPSATGESPLPNGVFLWGNANGNYSSTPSSGGITEIEPLHFTRNNQNIGNYDGTVETTINISVPTLLSQLSDDASHRLVTDTQITNWTAAYNWGDHSQAGYVVANNVKTLTLTIAGNQTAIGTYSPVNNSNTTFAVTKAHLVAALDSDGGYYLPLTGGTLTGNLTIGSAQSPKNLTVYGKTKLIAELIIPKVAPTAATIEANEIYFWGNSSGNYSSTPSSGGVTEIATLTISKNNTVIDSFDGTVNKTINIAVPVPSTTVTDGNGYYTTPAYVASQIALAVTSAIHYRGMSSTVITDGGTQTPTINGSPYTPQSGDVVIYGGFEFLWEENKWNKLGDDSSYALKTVTLSVSSTDTESDTVNPSTYYLTGGGDLSSSKTFYFTSAAKTLFTKAGTALQSSNMKALTLVVGSTTIGSNYNALDARTYTITKDNLTTTLESNSGYYVKKAGDTMTGQLNAQNIIPVSSNTYLLGSATNRWILNTSTISASDISTLSGGAYISTFLTIPNSYPQSPISGLYYLWANASGNYSSTPSGGGTGTISTLSLYRNNVLLDTFDGTIDKSIYISVPTDAQITTWNAKYDKPSGGIPASDLADSYVKQIKLGTTGTTYSPTSGLITLPAYPTTARGLDDANDLLFKDTDDTGTDVSIDVETGVTGTVLWGAESNTQVALSVNGATKILLKLAALDGIKSSIATLQGYFTNGSASNALKLGGYAASYFAPASAIPTSVSQLSNDSGYITNSVSDLTNYYLKSETYTKIEVQNLISSGSYTLPIASAGRLGGIRVGSGLSIDSTTGVLTATYSYTLPTASSLTKGGIKVGSTLSISNEILNVLSGSIAQNNSGYVTGGDIYSYINAIMSSSMKNIGVSSTAITNGGSETPTINGSPYTPNVNDVVFYDSKEFVWTASGTWRELGDESSFALKTTSISAGTGLTGGGTLSENRTISLSSATITSLGKADTALQSADMKALTLVVGSTTIGNDYNALAAKTYTISKSNLTTTLESDSGYYVKKTGDTMTGTLNSQSVIPTTTNTYSLGSSSLKYLDAYATTFYGALSGNASTATKLATARTLWGQSFDGSANVSGSLIDVADITATGFAQLPNIYASTSLAIPTATPSISASWYDATRYYLYANPNGNYSQTPSGGGGGGGALLTLTLNGDPFLTYNGSAAVTKNITAVQSSQVKTLTIKVASGDFTGNTFNPLDIANTIINIPQSALTTTLNNVYKIETPSGTSNRLITLGSNSFTIYAWALASTKPSYSWSEIGSHPTKLSDFTDDVVSGYYQPLDADLTAIAGLSGTSGFLKKTAANAWVLDTNSYLTTSATLDNVADGTTRKLSDYVPTTRKVNNKALSSDITLSLDDVADGSTRKLSDYVLTTSLNSWAGSQNITTLGTITTGVWNGTAIANNKLALDMSWAFVSNSATYDTTDLITVN